MEQEGIAKPKWSLLAIGALVVTFLLPTTAFLMTQRQTDSEWEASRRAQFIQAGSVLLSFAVSLALGIAATVAVAQSRGELKGLGFAIAAVVVSILLGGYVSLALILFALFPSGL